MDYLNQIFTFSGAEGFRKQKEPEEGIITGYGVVRYIERGKRKGKPVSGDLLALSLTKTELIDFISEGPIEGLISGEYKYQGTLGRIGYDSSEFNSYPTIGEVDWLRSVFWNQVP